MLLAILAEDTEVIKFIAGKIGANISHLQAVLEKQVEQYLKVEGGSVYASPELNQTFVNAQKAMHELGDEFITNEHLIARPFFRPFAEGSMHYGAGMLNQIEWALDRKNTLYDMLARGIPASTYAAGGVPLVATGNVQTVNFVNYNLTDHGSFPSYRLHQTSNTLTHGNNTARK